MIPAGEVYSRLQNRVKSHRDIQPIGSLLASGARKIRNKIYRAGPETRVILKSWQSRVLAIIPRSCLMTKYN